jgi:hypothetical protein
VKRGEVWTAAGGKDYAESPVQLLFTKPTGFVLFAG